MKESETLELKRSLAETNEILETISAFSNSKGGEILVGIEENKDGSVKEVVGMEIKGKEIENLTNEIKQNTDPTIFPSVEINEMQGKEILSIKVEESPFKPVFAKRSAFKRVGKTNRKLTSEEIRKLAKESVGFNITELVCKEATLKDIDEEKVQWFVRESKKQRNSNLEEGLPIKETLMRLNLLKNEKLTNAAILLFAKSPQKFFLQAEVKGVRFKGIKPVKPFIDFEVISGNIIDQVMEAERFVLKNIRKSVELVPGEIQRKEKYEFPPDAIREAIVNAIAHRDYESSSHVQIRIFDDRIEFLNPGRLPKELTVEDLERQHRSIPRNPFIAKQFYMINFVEELGTGTNDIINACVKNGLPEPHFEEKAGGLVVTLRKYRISDEILADLNERQRKAIKFLIKNKKITNKDYQDLCVGVSRKTLTRDLQQLVKKQVIKQKGERKGAYYELN